MALKDMKVTKAEAKAEKEKYSKPSRAGRTAMTATPTASKCGSTTTVSRSSGSRRSRRWAQDDADRFRWSSSPRARTQRREGEPDRSLTLQITKMDLTKGSAASAEAALDEEL
jgi:hypothetical protein